MKKVSFFLCFFSNLLPFFGAKAGVDLFHMDTESSIPLVGPDSKLLCKLVHKESKFQCLFQTTFPQIISHLQKRFSAPGIGIGLFMNEDFIEICDFETALLFIDDSKNHDLHNSKKILKLHFILYEASPAVIDTIDEIKGSQMSEMLECKSLHFVEKKKKN